MGRPNIRVRFEAVIRLTDFFGGDPHGKELVVARGFLRYLVVDGFKEDEVAHVGEQAVFWEKPFDECLHGACSVRLDLEAVYGHPRVVPFAAGRPRAVQGGDAVGDDDEAVVIEELGNLVGVMLDLVEGVFDGGFFVVGILEFEDDQRQAVDEDDDVGTAVVLPMNGKLIDGADVVLVRLIPVDRIDVAMFAVPVWKFHFQFDAACEHLVKGKVAAQGVGTFGLAEDAHGFIERAGGKVAIAAGKMGAEDIAQYNFFTRAFDIHTEFVPVFQSVEPLQGGEFKGGFGSAWWHKLPLFFPKQPV